MLAAIESMGLEPTRTSYQSPWQNGVAARFLGTVRRDLLDHVILLDDEHLRRLLGEYLAYYHADRTHLGVDKDAPLVRPWTCALQAPPPYTPTSPPRIAPARLRLIERRIE